MLRTVRVHFCAPCSCSSAAHLAEYFSQHQQGPNRRHTAVIGVPATIDGDIHNPYVEATLGFDTATKVYSQVRLSLTRRIGVFPAQPLPCFPRADCTQLLISAHV